VSGPDYPKSTLDVIAERPLTRRDENHADVRSMYTVHTLFRREFALMPGLVRGVTAGDKERAYIVADHIEFVSSVLHLHHHSEDEHLWPLLLDRESEEVGPLVRTLESQHASIEKIYSELHASMGIWRNNAPAQSRDAFADALDRMVTQLNEHMGLEESILPFVQRSITAAEWDQMLRAGGAEVPRESFPLLLGMLWYESEPELIQGSLSRMPPEVGPVLKELAPQTFASHSQRVHGTATPPRTNV
jgi:hemerythrin-like domain-containing protein